MLVSFIIPTYNASNTICRCLDSVYSLPLPQSEFEVITIDDCSTDSTVRIIESYSTQKKNLVLLRQSENHRQGAARNRGLSVAQSQYIVFLDSDDEIGSGIVSALELAKRNDLEMTAIRGGKISEEGQEKGGYELPYPQDKFFSWIDLQVLHPFWCTGPVMYVYSRLFLNIVNYPFSENVTYEDSDFVNVHLYHAKKMGYCDLVSYKIYDNPHSTTHTITHSKVCDYALLGVRMLAFYESLDDKECVYSKSILEGGSYNIMRACRNLFKLESFADVRAFYKRFDHFSDRKRLSAYREPAYCWNSWTRFCLKHKDLAMFIIGTILTTRILSLKTFFKKKHYA
jgi:glycosyltransferase involved in cell wall biosynthesis